MRRVILYISALLLSVACSRRDVEPASPSDRFAAAIMDASRELTAADIYDSLVPLEYGASPLVEWKIEGRDTMLLVATMQPQQWAFSDVAVGGSAVTAPSADAAVWVTIPGELRSKLSAEGRVADSVALNVRMLEILGLRPDGAESEVNLFWVAKNVLLRPSYDTDITTTHGAVDYPDGGALPEWYKEWFEANIAYSYASPREGLNYPFTRLGYTYDWGAGRSKYGLSEFITAPSSTVTLARRVGCWTFYNECLAK